MANDGQIVFEVTADGKHAIADIKEITKTIEQETGKWDKSVKESTDGMDDSFSKLIKKLSVAAIGAGIVNGLKNIMSASIEAASELQEVQNVVDVTFGENANQVESWAKNAGTQFGLTETQAKRFSSTMGAMLKSSGLAGQQIVDVSTDLAGLAADMASFYNLDFDEAFSKIRSGMAGMSMPLKELGIDMSVDTLNAFALAQGLEKTFSQMDSSEQTMLRYQYLMQATSDAQGDFARTSDGYANSMRKLETNIEGIKAKLGTAFIQTVADAVGALNGFLEVLIPEEAETTVLDRFAEINLNTEAKLAEIQQIKSEALATEEVLNRIYGNNEEDPHGEQAAEVVARYGVKSEETAKYLQSLGLSTDEIASKNAAWLETCKRLVKIIPGLNSIINTETGEVKGGKKAIDEYINAWEQGQKKLALLNAQAQKKQALADAYADLPGLEVDKLLTADKLSKAKAQLERYYQELGVSAEKQWKNINFSEAYAMGLTNDQRIMLNKELEYYRLLEGEANKAAEKYDKQLNAYKEGLKIIDEENKVIEDTYGSIEDATDATTVWSEEMVKAGSDAVNAAKDALTALADYAAGVKESVSKSVDSTVKGFGKIKTPMMTAAEKTKDLTDKLTKLVSRTKKNADEWDKLNEEINKYNSETISSQGIRENLKQQAEYMTTYLENLRKARELGISDSVLAELSDGSEESYDYLAALAEASPDEVREINAAYQSVIDKKKEMTDELTAQQLTVDKTYQSLKDKAKEAVDALDLEQEAKDNTGKTVQGMAQGIADHVGEVQSAVDDIISQLERLNGFGINIDLGGWGNIQFTTSVGKTEGSNRMGLDYVPHDDYIARLHEGEKVLTAQEASVYRGLANGSLAGVDLDALGGVMRDNVQPGGNVYLDGRIVGAVVSDRQGRSYKSMQRSGWQA